MEDSSKAIEEQTDRASPPLSANADVPPRPTLSISRPRVIDVGAEKEAARAKAVAENDGTASFPPKISASLTRAPRIGELYWCDLPVDAILPELWKKRSVVVISKNAHLHGTAIVLPTSSDMEKNPKYMREISCSLDERVSYAICDKPMTLAIGRFYRPLGAPPKLPSAEVDELLRILYQVIPSPPP